MSVYCIILLSIVFILVLACEFSLSESISSSSYLSCKISKVQSSIIFSYLAPCKITYRMSSFSFSYNIILFSVIGNFCRGNLKAVVPIHILVDLEAVGRLQALPPCLEIDSKPPGPRGWPILGVTVC